MSTTRNSVSSRVSPAPIRTVIIPIGCTTCPLNPNKGIEVGHKSERFRPSLSNNPAYMISDELPGSMSILQILYSCTRNVSTRASLCGWITSRKSSSENDISALPHPDVFTMLGSALIWYTSFKCAAIFLWFLTYQVIISAGFIAPCATSIIPIGPPSSVTFFISFRSELP